MKHDPSAIAVAILIFAVALYVGVVSPLTRSVRGANSQLDQEKVRLSETCLTVTQVPGVRSRIAILEATNASARACLISPLLNSHAMRARSLLCDRAYECGLVDVEYAEGEYRALPIPPERLPTRRTGRRTVVVKARGDYAAIASFVLRAERDLPMMTVQSVSITPGKNDDQDLQCAELILEWPCEGEVIK